MYSTGGGKKGAGGKTYDHLIKLIIIGDSHVGKSCILLRFSEGNIPLTHMPTIGIDFKIKTVAIEGQRVKLQVWDTAGQERFRTITQTYYKGAMGIILVYDCTEQQTYNNIQNWLKQIEAHASDNVVKVLVANKTDLPNRVVTEEKGQELADQHGLDFFETSAKNGQNINELFMHVAKQIIQKRPNETVSKQQQIQSSVVNQPPKPMQQNNGGASHMEEKGIQLGAQAHQKSGGNSDNSGGCCL